jgi:hypothetical protein
MGRIRNQQWDKYSGSTKGESAKMHGSIYIKDLSGNIHNQQFELQNYGRFDDNPADHAEDVLIRKAIERWSAGGRKMQSAKVTIAIWHSPCKRCCSRMKQTYIDLRDAICGGKEHNFYLVFAFAYFYLKQGDDGGKHAWESEAAAREAYRKLTDDSGTYVKQSKTGVDYSISRVSFWHEPLRGSREFIGTWVEA